MSSNPQPPGYTKDYVRGCKPAGFPHAPSAHTNTLQRLAPNPVRKEALPVLLSPHTPKAAVGHEKGRAAMRPQSDQTLAREHLLQSEEADIHSV